MKAPKWSTQTPKQQRSRRSLDRILIAVERLLLKRSFQQLSIREITRASKTSVGSFYNLFPSKEALLPGLYERYDAGLDAWIAEWRARQGRPPSELPAAIAWVVQYLVETFSARRHLLRALALWTRTNPEQLGTQALDRRVSQHAFLGELLLEHRDQITHPEPQRAVQSALFAAASICRERVLFGEGLQAKSAPAGEAQLPQDVTCMILGLLRPEPMLDLHVP